MTAPNTLPAHGWGWWVPGGAFQAWRVTNPSAPLGWSEKGVAKQGTGSLCFPAPPALPLLSCIPWPPPARKLLQRFLGQELEGRLVLSDQGMFARVVFDHFTKRKYCASSRQE